MSNGEPKVAAARSKLGPGLHVVATPIGHLGDLSPRALATMTDADLLACEDTRETGKLLARHGVRRPLLAYHEHNAATMRPRLLAALTAGGSVALVSDAGTPLVSDPGYRLVRAAIDAGVPVLAVPGPSACLAALTVSGLPSDRFLVAGFLPAKATARRQALAELASVPATLIAFETAPRLASCLADMAAVLGPRPAAVARELTKRFEEVRRATLDALAAHYAAVGPPKGEIVVVIGPPPAQATPLEAADAALIEALQTRGPSAAAAKVAAATGLARAALYKRALALKN